MLHLLAVVLLLGLLLLASALCALGYQCSAWWRQWQVRRQTKAWHYGPGGSWRDLL